MRRLKIGLAKLGKSIKFRRKYWNANGGDNEPLAMLQSLANNYPDIDWYIINRSDWHALDRIERAQMFPHGNVHDTWEGKDLREYDLRPPDREDRVMYLDDISTRYDNWLIEDFFDKHGVRLDHAVIMPGAMCIANLRGITRLKGDPSKYVRPLVMCTLFSAPTLRWLNEHRPPYIEVITDQLYDVSQARDLFHFPKHSLGQYNHSYVSTHIRSYEDQTHIDTSVPSTYAPIETLFCVGRKPAPYETERDIDFAVVANERRPSRWPMLTEWILDQFGPDEVRIYGKWASGRAVKTWETAQARVEGDARFAGALHIDELHQALSRTKTTFVVPQHKGGVTSKWVEMLHSGVVPFFHPGYDTQKHVKVPEYLRPRTPRELRDRVRAVTTDEDARIALMRHLRAELLHEGYYNGSILAEKLVGIMCSDLGVAPPKLQHWTPREEVRPAPAPTVSSLQEFFA